MEIVERLDEFIRSKNDNVFIEVEGKPNRIDDFIYSYNSKYSPCITKDIDGVIVLQDDANKWGIELRLYLNYQPEFDLGVKVTRNRVYRPEYPYRINDVEIIRGLFDIGYRIGKN